VNNREWRERAMRHGPELFEAGYATCHIERVWQAIQAVVAVAGATAIGMNLANDRGSSSRHCDLARAAGYSPTAYPDTGDLA
jgi:hypothetical protein